MNQGDRRIRSLKIRSRDEALLWPARFCLEEAFRTASLPGLPPNAVLLVRRLDLGAIRVDQPPVALADRIGELVRRLASAAVCVDERSAAKADVVCVSDPLQPSKALLLRLLDGKSASEWYWRTLFPGQALVLNADTVEMVLARAAGSPLKGLAISRVLEEALAPRRLARLLACITGDLVRRLLHAQGLSPVAVASAAPLAGPKPEAAGSAAMRAAAAPAIGQPWRHAIRDAARCWGGQDVRTLWFAWQALILQSPAWIERREALHRIVTHGWLESWAADHAAEAAQESAAGARDAAAVVAAGNGSDDPVHEARAPAGKTAAPPPSADSLAANPAGVSPVGELARPKAAPGETRDGTPAGGRIERAAIPAETDSAAAGAGPSAAEASADIAARFSEHAGFAFLIPLLQRLGMAELLAADERLVMLDLPRQLLWSLAQRFGLAERDPMRSLFDGFEPSADAVIAPFAVPALWQRLATASARRIGIFRSLERQGSLRLHELTASLQLLAALHLRSRGGLSLRALIRRPGRVVLTATHWDTIFDLDDTDLRLRRIALDSDPGWVPWLGRVVQFHYDSEGERHA